MKGNTNHLTGCAYSCPEPYPELWVVALPFDVGPGLQDQAEGLVQLRKQIS
jgi:hypothetical protein